MSPFGPADPVSPFGPAGPAGPCGPAGPAGPASPRGTCESHEMRLSDGWHVSVAFTNLTCPFGPAHTLMPRLNDCAAAGGTVAASVRADTAERIRRFITSSFELKVVACSGGKKWPIRENSGMTGTWA